MCIHILFIHLILKYVQTLKWGQRYALYILKGKASDYKGDSFTLDYVVKCQMDLENNSPKTGYRPVSYTHLTLPTILLV